MLFVIIPLIVIIGLVIFEHFNKPAISNKETKTIKPMTREERLKICENCRFCERDMRGMICGKTNEYADFEGECKEFEPSKKYMEKTSIQRKKRNLTVDDNYAPAITYIICGAVWMFLMVALEDGKGGLSEIIIPVSIIIAICAIIVGIALFFVRWMHRKNIEAEVFKSRLLTKEKLMDIIRFEGYYPQLDEDGDIIFKIDGDTFNVEYNEAKLSLSYVFLMSGVEREIRELATQVADNIMMSKIFITTFPDHDDIVVSISLDTYCVYDYECKKVFAAYLRIVRETIARFYRGYEAIQHTKDPQELRRGDIYEPEFRWMPDVLFKAISEGTLDPAALTNEDWIRKNIQKNAAISYVAQEWDSFKINRVDNYGDYKLIVYQFPEPKVVPEAKYGAVLMNTKTLAIDYYTLEMTYNGKWVYGSMSTECHNNYGEVDTGYCSEKCV